MLRIKGYLGFRKRMSEIIFKFSFLLSDLLLKITIWNLEKCTYLANQTCIVHTPIE